MDFDLAPDLNWNLGVRLFVESTQNDHLIEDSYAAYDYFKFHHGMDVRGRFAEIEDHCNGNSVDSALAFITSGIYLVEDEYEPYFERLKDEETWGPMVVEQLNDLYAIRITSDGKVFFKNHLIKVLILS